MTGNASATSVLDSAQTSAQTPADSGAAQTGSDPNRATDGRFEPREWRYPNDYHVDWMRGKTADEVGQISQQLYQSVLGNQSMPAQPNQSQQWSQPQPQWNQPAPGPQPPTPEEWLNDPSGAAQKDWDYRMATQLRPQISQYADALGSQARTIVEMRDPDAFRKWGPEIDLMLRQVDPGARTVDNIQMVVGIVKSRHLDEIVQERTRDAITRAQEAGTLRSGAEGTGTSAAGTAALDFSNAGLPPNYRRLLDEHRVTEQTMREFFAEPSMRKSFTGNPNATFEQCVEKWLESAKKQDLLTEKPLRIGG